MKFSEKIIQARKAKALTQEDLSEAVGVSRQAVSKWETGEANPDLDKLVAICKVLDLSMDYLCLDKQPEVTVEPPQPAKPKTARYLIAGVCIGLVAAILVGLLAMGLMGNQNDPTLPNTSNPTVETKPDYAEMLSKIQVADGKFEPRNAGTWRITFVPNIQYPGMQVQIAVRNNKIGTTYYIDTTKDGAGFYIEYRKPDHEFNVDFIAICMMGDVTVQLPLINVEGDGGRTYAYDYLWNK
ncbi:MAG: helix-turn-helix transcriptional regulator [Oscillospiraceae bacterium]|nr:helix-turn-helix transcriptional regulator [Oscillospiraceae bacterium]